MPEPTDTPVWTQHSHMHAASAPAAESDASEKRDDVSKERYLLLTWDADKPTPLSKMATGTIQHCDAFEQKLVQ